MASGGALAGDSSPRDAAPVTIDTIEALTSNIPGAKEAASKRLLWLLQLTRYQPYPRELYAPDYKHVVTHSFADGASGDKVTVEEFAPLVFASVRDLCGIEQEKFAVEWSLAKEEKEAFEEKDKESILVFSRTKLLFVCAISTRQAELILDGLDVYTETCSSNHNLILLHRFGLFRMGKQYFAVFNSFLGTGTPRAEYMSRISKLLESSTGENLKEVNRIFGVPLAVLVGTKNQLPDFLPTVVRRLGQFHANDRSFQFESLFTSNWDEGNAIEKTQDALERGSTVDTISDPKLVAGILLSFLRDLPDDIVNKEVFGSLRFCVPVADKKEQMRLVQCIIVQIPAIYRSLLRYIVDTIAELAATSQDSMKALDTISACFAPLVIAPMRAAPSEAGEGQGVDDALTSAISNSGGISMSSAMLSFKKGPAAQSQPSRPSIFSLMKKKDGEPPAPAQPSSAPPPKKTAETPGRRNSQYHSSRSFSSHDLTARVDVLKMLILCGASVFQMEVTRLKFVEEHGRVLIAKATLPELVAKLLDENYEEKEFPMIFFSCLRYFADYNAIFEEFRKEFPGPRRSSVSEVDDVKRVRGDSRTHADDKDSKESKRGSKREDKDKAKKDKKDEKDDKKGKPKETEEVREKRLSEAERRSVDESSDDDTPRLTLRRRQRILEILNALTTTHVSMLPDADSLKVCVKKFLSDFPPSREKALRLKNLLSFASHGVSPTSRVSLMNASAEEPKHPPVAPPPLAERPAPALRSSVENSLFTSEMPVREIAEQLTIIDLRYLERIPPNELFNKNWEKREKSPYFHSVLTFTNNLSGWCISWILSCSELPERALRFGNLIDCAWECVNIGNFQSAMTIFSAVQSSSVDRLKGTKALINKSSMKNFDDLSKLFAMERNYQRYRKRLQQTNPAIPYLAGFTKELFMIEEGNTSVHKESLKDGQLELINISKFRMIFNTVSRFQKYQQMRFPYKVKSPYFEYLATAQTELSANELRTLSNKLEPKDSSADAGH